MDPVQFFDILLPSRGLRCCGVPALTKDGRPYVKHFWGAENSWLAEATHHLDANREQTVYYAVASYKADGEKTEHGQLRRIQANVEAVRSFWLDIDVGPSKAYASQRDAAQAVLTFALKLDLPKPFIVRSGGGIHVYWPMSEDMSPALWQPTAQLLKAACAAESLHADPTRTADHASILRPPGTHHRKAEPRPVVVAVAGDVGDLATFQSRLLPYAAGMELPGDDPFGETPDHLKGFGGNEDLSGGIERRPCSAERAAEACGVLRMVRDTHGNVDQPTWYHALGILAVADDGVDLVQPWSDGHPDYSDAEATRKFEQYAKLGKAPTCAKLGEHHLTICAACPHSGKVKTPFTLGLYEPGSVITAEQTVRTSDGSWKTIPLGKMDMPDGFKIVGRQLMHRTYNDASEQWEDTPFCDTVFYPVGRLSIEGIAHIEFEMPLREGGNRRFVIDGGTIGKGKDVVAAELGRREIVALDGKGQVMDSYMKRWMTQLKDNADQITAYRSFGWSEDRSFCLGDTVLHPGGHESRAVLQGMAKSRAPALSPKGDLSTWISLIDRAYNAPGQEAYQFIVGCGFAAPLLSMLKQVNGVTVYAHSDASGTGKTTAQRAALSAWGNWDQLMLAEGKTTANAMWALMGAYHSIPVVFDELTNQRNDVASDLVFSVSSGRSKERMRADGELRENNSNWATIMLASGNTLLSEKLALHRSNAEAEVSRLFEFTMRVRSHLAPNEANQIFPQLIENYGHAGRVFMRHVVDNYDAVRAKLLTTQEKINTALRITQVERHWSALLASVLVAVAECRDLGLLSFPMVPLHNWIVDRLNENRVTKQSVVNGPLELFGMMLSDLWQGILVTRGEGDMRRGQLAAIVEKPRGTMVGRAILPDNKNSVPVLMLNSMAIRDWANKKGVSAKEIFAAAVDAGWCDKAVKPYSLGRGTIEYSQVSSAIQCWKINPDRVTTVDAGQPIAQKLATVQGGKGNAAGSGA